jgi:hypothetical protein
MLNVRATIYYFCPNGVKKRRFAPIPHAVLNPSGMAKREDLSQ